MIYSKSNLKTSSELDKLKPQSKSNKTDYAWKSNQLCTAITGITSVSVKKYPFLFANFLIRSA